MKKKKQYIRPEITLTELKNDCCLLAGSPPGIGEQSIIFDETSQNEEVGPGVSSSLWDDEDIP